MAPPKNSALRLRAIAVGISVIAIAITWILVALHSATDKARELAQAQNEVADLAKVLAEHATFGLNSAARLAEGVKSEIEQGHQYIHEDLLVRYDIGGDHIVQLAIANARGDITYSSVGLTNANIQDRPHFQIHVERDLGHPFVSVPVLGRVSKRWTIQVTRRISARNFSFAGVVVVSIDPYYYTKLYSSLSVGANGVVATVGMDGIVRSRLLAGREEGTGADLSHTDLTKAIRSNAKGTLLTQSEADGLLRLYGFHRVHGYPLAIVVGKAQADILKDYTQRRYRDMLVATALTLGILFGLKIILATVRKEEHLLQEVEIARKEAESLSTLKSRFITTVSHEMRTPLTSALGFSEILANSPIDPELRDYARMLNESAQQISRIVDDIVDVAKADKGELRLASTTINPEIIIRRVAEMHAVAAEAKNLRLCVQTGGTPPGMVIRADERRLIQVISQLVNNAIKHTDSGGVTLRVTITGNLMTLDVSDTGSGILPETQPMIFELFQSTHPDRRAEGGGLGMGLAHAKLVSELMGGRLILLHSDQHGTTFRLSLPLTVD